MPNPNFDAPERRGDFLIAPVALTTTIYAGNLAALDSTGNAVEAADVAGLRCQGRLELDIVNGLTYQNDTEATIKRGVFLYQNSATNPLTQAKVGSICYVQDSQTVAATSANKVKAGLVVEVDPTGVYVDTRRADTIPLADTLSGLPFTTPTAAEVEALRAAVHAAFQAAGLML